MKDYLEGLRVSEFDRKIADERKTTEKETWNLDQTMLVFMYEKLNHYKDVTDTDMTYHTFTTFNLKEVTEAEMIEEILQDIRDMYNDTEDDYRVKNIRKMRLFHNIAQIFDHLWW